MPAGTYYIEASAPAGYVGYHTAKLRNITDSLDTIIGTTEISETGSGYVFETRSFILGRFTIVAQKVFEIQHRSSNDYGSGFGLAFNFGVVQVYTDVRIWKIQ